VAKVKKDKWTGSVIYNERYPRPQKSASAAKYVTSLRASLIQDKTLAEALESRREKFAALLRPYVRRHAKGDTVLDLGDGWQRYDVATDAPETARDAVQGMDSLFLLSQPKLSSEHSAQLWFKLGVLVQFLEGSRALESLANSGFDYEDWHSRSGRHDSLTPLAKSQSKTWFNGYKKNKLSNNDAYANVRDKLKSELGLKVSISTVRNTINAANK
jgi:hypothetical protein